MFVFSYKLAYVHKYQRLRYLSRFFLYVRLVTKEYPLHFPHPGWSEQDPEAWWEALLEGIPALRFTKKSMVEM